jgi:sortase A
MARLADRWDYGLKTMIAIPRPLAGAVPALVLALSGCTTPSAGPEAVPATTPAPTATATATTSVSSSPTRKPTPEMVGRPSPTPSRQAEPKPTTARPQVRSFVVSVPAIGIRSLETVVYSGRPDDGPGTRIQDRGIAASPIGDRGGERLGELGNVIVTAHRTSAGGPFRELPDLREGERIEVAAGGLVYVYKVTGTRETSFRSQRSLAEQAAAVPGYPGRTPTQSMITLSTCATPEDRAAGNYWSDQYGNPEHRIDKIGVLVDTRPAA